MQTRLSLRPLSVGEIFDRTATVAARTFLPLFAIAGVYEGLGAALGLLAGDGVRGLLLAIASPLAAGAVAIGAASGYEGRSPSIDAAYGVAARCYGSLLMTMLRFIALGGLVLGFVGIAAVLAGIALVGAIGGVSRPADVGARFAHLSPGVAIAFTVVVCVATVALFVLSSIFSLANVLAVCACAVERLSSGAAYHAAWRLLTAPTERRRTLGICFAYFAIVATIEIVLFGGLALIALPLHRSVLARPGFGATLWTAAVASVTLVFTYTFGTVYYLELRTRRDGLDLRRAIDAAPTLEP